MAAEKAASLQDIVEILLKNRGVGRGFLNGSLKDLEPHLAIRGIDEGAELMARHLSEGSKLVLVGDYDCDGITSVAQLSHFLNDIGYANYEVVIPDRADGYGIPEKAVNKHPDAALFVAMDCGTLDVRPVEMIRARGADCIVIDHHEVPQQGIAPATVLINPKQPACCSTFKEFCASGLTLLFIAKLRQSIQGMFRTPILGAKYLILATIGTVADLVPLVEANRLLAQSGLSQVGKGIYGPVEQIVDVAGLSGRSFTAGHIGYYVGPRINAAGRMANARIAYDLLLSEHPEETRRLAQELNRLNAKRQYEEDLVLQEIRRRFTHAEGRRTLVVGAPDWPAGIIGIVASRIQQELHYGPCIVFSMDPENGVARGSARSIPGFDIHGALKRCERHLLKWGGHKMAAGMSIAMERIDDFTEEFERVALEHEASVFVPRAKVDLELDLNFVSPDLLDTLKQLEPHGIGNPVPTFAARRVKVSVQKVFGRDQSHVRLLVDNGIAGIFWRGLPRVQALGLNGPEPVDLVFQLEWDDFSKQPALNVKDLGQLF